MVLLIQVSSQSSCRHLQHCCNKKHQYGNNIFILVLPYFQEREQDEPLAIAFKYKKK